MLPETPDCDRWESKLDCLKCAACCGPAFDAVEVSKKDARRLEGLVALVRTDGRLQVARTDDNRCSALGTHNRCHVYEERPRCCRDFEKGSANCVFARRRVGLSPLW